METTDATSGAIPADESGPEPSRGTEDAADPDVPSAPADTGTGAATPPAPDETDGADGSDDGRETDDDGAEPGTSTGAQLEGCEAYPNALVCEDFEAELDPGRWILEEEAGATVTVEDGMMHVQLGSQDRAHGFIQLQPDQVFPLEGDNHFFGRVLMRFDPAMPNRHNYIINAYGPLDGATARYRLDSNGGGHLNSRYTHPTVDQHGGWRKGGYEAQPSVWTCIEWEYDGESNSMRYWFDDVLNTDMEVDGATEDPPWVAPRFEHFEIGLHTYQGAENGDAFDVWFDDLILSTERVGC